MVNEFTFYFLILCISFVSFNFFGTLIFSIFKIHLDGFYVTHFTRMAIGMTVFVVCTAICFTKGNSIFILYLPLLSILAFRFGFKERSKWKFYLNFSKEYMCIFLAALLLFAFRFYAIHKFSSDITVILGGDIHYYAQVSNFISETGFENCSLDYAFPEGVSPYHYFELWFCAGIQHIFNTNSVLTLYYIIYPLGTIILWLGICALMEQYRKLKFLDVIFAFVLLSVSGIFLNLIPNLHFMRHIGTYLVNGLNFPKFLIIYILITSSILFYKKTKIFESIICLLAIPISFISTAPGIFTGVTAWIILEYFLNKKLLFKEALTCVAVSIAIISFYFVLNSSLETFVNIETSYNHYFQYNYWKTFFNIIVGTSIHWLIICFLYFMLFAPYLKWDKEYFLQNKMFMLSVCFVASSLLFWGVLNNKLDAVQVFTNISVPLINTGLCIFIIHIYFCELKKANLFIKLLLAFILLLTISQSEIVAHVSLKKPKFNLYYNQISSANLSRIGGLLLTSEDYKKIGYAEYSCFVYSDEISNAKNKTINISISCHLYPFAEDTTLHKFQAKHLAQAPFNKFLKHQKKNYTFKNIETSQLAFINKMQMNYIICYPKARIPQSLLPKIKEIITDSNTGRKLILLK